MNQYTQMRLLKHYCQLRKDIQHAHEILTSTQMNSAKCVRIVARSKPATFSGYGAWLLSAHDVQAYEIISVEIFNGPNVVIQWGHFPGNHYISIKTRSTTITNNGYDKFRIQSSRSVDPRILREFFSRMTAETYARLKHAIQYRSRQSFSAVYNSFPLDLINLDIQGINPAIVEQIRNIHYKIRTLTSAAAEKVNMQKERRVDTQQYQPLTLQSTDNKARPPLMTTRDFLLHTEIPFPHENRLPNIINDRNIFTSPDEPRTYRSGPITANPTDDPQSARQTNEQINWSRFVVDALNTQYRSDPTANMPHRSLRTAYFDNYSGTYGRQYHTIQHPDNI